METTNYHAAVEKCREAFATRRTTEISFRKRQLRQLHKCMTENEDAFCNALKKDLNRPKFEALFAEIVMVSNEISLALSKIDEWAKPEKQPSDFLSMSASVEIRKQPYGVCLIISSWNYPVSLLLTPLVGAIAAGNCAVLKPSECAKETARLMQDLLPRYLDPECYPVVVLGPAKSAELTKTERFDHIFFTGGTAIGRHVMRAAAEFLTPVVLELGGKNPCFVDTSANLHNAAKRIVWGKLYNAGQICLSPDYIMCESAIRDKLVSEIKKVIRSYYGEDPSKSENFCRLINARQFQRLKSLMDKVKSSGEAGCGRMVSGGRTSEKDLYIEPTIFVDVAPSSPLMENETFGPFALVMTVSEVDEAIDIINAREKPLSLYIFSKNQHVVDKMLNRTSSGGVTVNDTLMHYSSTRLPFGGVGESGMGAYHGRHSFDCFSHRRSCFIDGTPEAALAIRYPPYSDRQTALARFALTKKLPREGGILGCFMSYIWLGVLGVALAFGFNYFFN